MHGDPLRMYQVVHNLVDNAIKYTPSGEVALRYARTSSGTYTIDVSDTGIGIPKDVRDTIFEPFRRVQRTNETGSGQSESHDAPNGFGLGLSIVKQLVQMMNGEIRVTSEEGKGSTFSVRLPFQTAAEGSA
jgi:signal transduction histidine kinase